MTPTDPPSDQAEGRRLDAAAVKVLAHPLRNRMLGRLRGRGTATATELAEDLGTNTGATSYHLRKLEEVGLVVDTGEGTGRRRLWRAASQSHQWAASDFAGDEDAETALGWLERDYIRLMADRSNRWLDVERDWPLAWRDALGISDDHVVATADQVVAMLEEIDDVIQRYKRVGQGNPTARRVSVWTVKYPIDLDRPPRSEP